MDGTLENRNQGQVLQVSQAQNFQEGRRFSWLVGSKYHGLFQFGN